MVDENRVGPLYKHVFPPQLAPTLSFVGIPSQYKYLDWLAAQVGLAPTEEQLKKIYDKMIELIIISWVGFRELAILKTKISARLISRCFLASKFAIILDQTITVLVKSLVLFPSIPFYCSSIVF
nr:flavin-containing monooxygenase FMO GS-OX-like 6 [Coffea arabica]